MQGGLSLLSSAEKGALLLPIPSLHCPGEGVRGLASSPIPYLVLLILLRRLERKGEAGRVQGVSELVVS